MPYPPYRILVMGVSGSGKSTIGQALAKKHQLTWIEGDKYHPEENKKKMASGVPLTDEDRKPWLEALADVCAEKEGEGFVLACSALKQSYRHILASKMKFKLDIFLFHGSPKLIAERMQSRSHFMPLSLLNSQLETLEITPDLIQIPIESTTEEILNQINAHLDTFDMAVIGLGVMGKSLARNFASRGIRVIAYNLPLPGEEAVTTQFIHDHGSAYLHGAASLPEMMNRLARPRKILLMVKSGAPVDEVIENLQSNLEEGDIIIDAGNSYFHDTRRRYETLQKQGLEFVGMGVSGGEEGALLGPSMMPAGSDSAKKLLLPLFQKTAAFADNNSCVTWIGNDGSGHFVKMVHNGIEYAEMQIIAEMYHIAKNHLQPKEGDLHQLFQTWNQGESASYLLEITVSILQKKEGNELLLEKILDVAGSKGTGLWTVREALELEVAIPTISAALQERMISKEKSLRVALSDQVSNQPKPIKIDRESLKSLMVFARMVALAEGFFLMQKAASHFQWQLQLADLAQIWRGGCIIRSELLMDIRKAYEIQPDLLHLFASPSFGTLLQDHYLKAQAAYQQLLEMGTSIPAISAAMQYYRSMHTRYLPTNLIQAQRDYFGAHTYQKLEGGQTFFHTKWEED